MVHSPASTTGARTGGASTISACSIDRSDATVGARESTIAGLPPGLDHRPAAGKREGVERATWGAGAGAGRGASGAASARVGPPKLPRIASMPDETVFATLAVAAPTRRPTWR